MAEPKVLTEEVLKLAREIVEHYEAKGRTPVYTDMHLVAKVLIERLEPVKVAAGKRHRMECGACEYAVATNWKCCAECGRPIQWA